MITGISLLLTLSYLFLMTYFVSTAWYLIILWVVTALIIFYLLSLLLIVFTIGIMLPALKHTSRFKNCLVREMGWWLMVFAFNARIKVLGKENLPKAGKLTIYANHKSKIDPIYLSQAITRPHGYGAKSDLKKVGLIDRLNRGMNSFYVYRDDNRETLKELLKGIERAKDGHTFIIFPEGGTMYRDHQDIREVRPGAFKLAQKAETDILPVTILNSHKWALRKFYLIPFRVTVIIHPVIKYDDYKDLDTNQISEKVINIINSGIK